MEQILKNGLKPGCIINTVDIAARKHTTFPLLPNGLFNIPDSYSAKLYTLAEIFIVNIQIKYMGMFSKNISR